MSVSQDDLSLHHILNEFSDPDDVSDDANEVADEDKSPGKVDAANSDRFCDNLNTNDNPPNDNLASPAHQLSLRELMIKHGPKIAKAYDDEVVTASWHELESRSISGERCAAKQTLAPYLLEKNNMWFGTHRDQQGRNGRVLHCPICKLFRVPLVRVRDTVTKQFLHFKLNKKHPRYDQYTTAKCNCVSWEQRNMIPPASARKKNARTLTVYGVALLNHPKVRSLVDKFYFMSFPSLRQKVENLLTSKFRVPEDVVEYFVKHSSTTLSEVVQCLHIRSLYKSQFLYHKLPAYLEKFLRENPSASAALQPHYDSVSAPTEALFGRLFVGFPIAEFQNVLTLPVLQIDCFHYQCHSYDGVAIILCSKTGFGKIILLAFGIIPVEDTNNIAWFLQMCVRHGINFSDCPLFTDRGPLLSAVRRLDTVGFNVNIMICLQHFIRNVRHMHPQFFKDNHEAGPLIENAVHDASEVLTVHHFFAVFTSLQSLLFELCGENLSSIVELMKYVLQFHPSHWTIVGNTTNFNDEDYLTEYRLFFKELLSSLYLKEKASAHHDTHQYKELLDAANNFGTTQSLLMRPKKIHNNSQKCATFYNTKTNMAESMAGLMLHNDGRRHHPPLSIIKFFEVYNAQVRNLFDDLKGMHNDSSEKPANQPVPLTTLGYTVSKLNQDADLDATRDVSENINNLQYIDHQKTSQTHRTMSAMFHDHQSTYCASLTWTIASNLFGPKEVTHKCERHVMESSVFQCPCTCIRALARKAINDELPGWKPSDDSPTLSNQLDSLYPNAMRSEFCHHHVSGRKTSLSLKIPNYDSVTLSQSPGTPLLQPARKFKKQMPTRRHLSRGEKGFPAKKALYRKTPKRDGTARFANEKTRAMRSKSAPRDKKTLRNLAGNAAGGALSQSQLEAAAKLSKIHEPKTCITCKTSGCNQSKCLLLHTFFRGIVNRKDLVFDREIYVVYKFRQHQCKQPFSSPHYNIEGFPQEFSAEEIKTVNRAVSSSLDCELRKTKQSTTNADNGKCKNHYLKDVEKYLEKSHHLMGFKTKHTKPINSIVSVLQRIILKKLDPDFDHHENIILSSEFKPQKYPTGTPVRKRFGKQGWFDGKVVEFWSDSNCRCYKILYEDGDKSDVDESDMEELVSEYDKAHHRDCTSSSDDGDDGDDDMSKGSSSDATPVCSDATPVCSNTRRKYETNQSN